MDSALLESDDVDWGLDDNAASDGARLRDLDFTDLFIDERGRARMRGTGERNTPLVDVPPGLVVDIEDILRKAREDGAGRNEFPLDYDTIRYRVTRIEAQYGETMAFRRLLSEIPRLSYLGLQPMATRCLGRIGRAGSGLILVSGPTGSGKTTTIGSILQEYLIRFGDVAITIEDPPELPLERQYEFGVCYQYRVENGNFAEPMRRALRSQPKYILVGEIRDPEGASTLLRAAQSGHVCLATIHSSTIEQALTSLIKYVATDLSIDLAQDMLASSIAAVINQRLTTFKGDDGVVRRGPKAHTLFFRGSEKGLPAMIREGKISSLKNEIDRQQILIGRGLDPFQDPPGHR